MQEIIPGLSEDSTTCSRRGPSLISTRAVVGTIPGPLGRRERRNPMMGWSNVFLLSADVLLIITCVSLKECL